MFARHKYTSGNKTIIRAKQTQGAAFAGYCVPEINRIFCVHTTSLTEATERERELNL